MAPGFSSGYNDQMEHELTIEGLQEKLQHHLLNNSSPSEGFALLAIVPRPAFGQFHLPGAECVPPEDLESCQGRFERDKQIVVYGCDMAATRTAVEQLRQLGFRLVQPLLGNINHWQQSGVTGMQRRLGFPERSPQTTSIDSNDTIDGRKRKG